MRSRLTEPDLRYYASSWLGSSQLTLDLTGGQMVGIANRINPDAVDPDEFRRWQLSQGQQSTA